MKLSHPYENLANGEWLRGNLHAHSTNSDGKTPRQTVIDDYARQGYDFLMVSDHDFFTSAEDYAGDDNRGMVLIPGNEVSRSGPHMLHVNGTAWVEPDADRQKVLDTIAAQQGFVVVNHPNWFANFCHCPQELLNEWNGYCGIEIYNAVIGPLEGSPYATDRWDMLLNEGRKVWGFANDDSHAPEHIGQGYNVVFAERNVDSIVNAMAAGRFYASSGVTISEIAVDGRDIRIVTENADRIVALRNVARRIKVVDGNEMTLTVPDDATYIRFECWGRGESFAWTQPFWVES